jgi:hypothetical protein
MPPLKPIAQFGSLVKAIAAQTGIKEADIRRVLTAAYPSTRDFVLKEHGKNLAAGFRRRVGTVAV